jgi:hypothetical protein
MKTNTQKTNWIIDAVLFAGMILASLFDLTGLSLHQWLGAAVGALAGYHLFKHWTWVKTVFARLFGRTSNQARLYFLVDVGLFSSLTLVLLTGLAISTWFNFSSLDFSAWRHVHVTATIAALGFILVKIAIHSRWIIHTARRSFWPEQPAPAPLVGHTLAAQPLPVGGLPASVKTKISRRDFLKLMGISGAATLVALNGVIDAIEDVEADPSASQQESSPSTITTAALSGSESRLTDQESSSSSSCSLRCNRRCSFPGHCHRYQDANKNGRCDLGECL